jgi:tetratricopeptide (TPR) repeat protein
MEQGVRKKSLVIRHHLFAIIIIVLLSTGIYLNTLSCPFYYDDISNIVENPLIRELKNIPKFFSYNQFTGKFRAIPAVTFAFDYYFSNKSPIRFHITNILFHTVNGILVYIILLELFGLIKKNVKIRLSLFISLLFISNPIQTNVVNYIVQRNGELATFFYLLAFFLFIKGRLLSGFTKVFFYTGSVFFFFCSSWSKEIGFTFPIMIAIFEFIFMCKDKKMLLNRLAIFSVFFIPYTIYILFFFRGNGIIREVQSGLWGPWQNLLTQANVIIEYIKLLILPLPGRLNIDHDFKLAEFIFEYPTFVSIITILSLIVLAIYLVRKEKIASFAILWFFITLIPTSSIIPLWEIIAEYRLYLPGFGFYLLLGLTIDYVIIYLRKKNKKGFNWDKIRCFVFVGIVFFYSMGTYQRIFVWKDELTLWEDAVSKSPKKPKARNNLGNAYYNKGLYKEAIREYKRAVFLFPDWEKPYNNLGNVYAFQRLYTEAIEKYKESIKINPNFAKAYNNLGNAYNQLGLYDKAITVYKKALEIRPDFPEFQYNLALAYKNQGIYDKAIKAYKRVLKMEPNFGRVYYHLGLVYKHKGFDEKAISAYKKMIIHKPNFINTYINLSILYLDKKLYDHVIDLLKKALELKLGAWEVHNNLGVAYLRKNQFLNAMDEFQKAIRINPDIHEIYYNMACLYSLNGETNKAIKFIKKAIEKGFNNFEHLKRDPDLSSIRNE